MRINFCANHRKGHAQCQLNSVVDELWYKPNISGRVVIIYLSAIKTLNSYNHRISFIICNNDSFAHNLRYFLHFNPAYIPEENMGMTTSVTNTSTRNTMDLPDHC